MNATLTWQQKMHIYTLEAKTEFLKVFRMPAFAIPSLIFPMMFYIFFALVFNRGGMNGQVPMYMLATYGVFGIIGPAIFAFGVGVAIEKDQGWLALKQCSPMPISAYFFARIVTAMLFALIIVISLFTIGALFGNVRMTSSQWLFTLILLILGCLPFCAIGLWLGLALKGQTAPAVVNLIYLPMAFLSGLWIPIQMFPAALQNAAWALPPFHLAQLVLKIQDNDLGYPWWVHTGILLVMTLIFLFLAMRAFKKISESK
ncbi:ABC transporter permease [Marinicella sp. W31]|uniref:ABC transporter permease n=1 Tax=Marinicella sp. W31 TaxID=3023713 RepID=UPI003757C783